MNTKCTVSSRSLAGTRGTKGRALYLGLCGLGVGLPASAQEAAAVPNAKEVVLHHFASPRRGAYPDFGVIRDPAGNLYGTADSGGASNAGVAFEIKPE